MTTSRLEDRIRAHYEERAARETFDSPIPPLGGAARRATSGRRLVLVAAAAAVVVALIAAFLDSGDERVRTVNPGPIAPPNRTVIVGPQGVLGGWTGTSWSPSDAADWKVPLEGGERFWVLSIGVAPVQTVGGAPRAVPCRAFGGEHQATTVDVPGVTEEGHALAVRPIALFGVVNPLPRETTPVGGDDTRYRDIARDALASYGAGADVEPDLVQLYRTDLEGDGDEEILMVAEHLTDRSSIQQGPGDYSLALLVRNATAAEPEVDILSGWRHTDGSGINLARISAVADLNGDGIMELVLQSYFGDRDSMQVIATGPAEDHPVLTCRR